MFKTADANTHDVNNYDVSRDGVGKAAQIPDLIADLYHLVYQQLLPKLTTDERQTVAVLSLTLNAKHLILGINSLYRLYASQMFREARSAAEATAIANLILRDKKAYEVSPRIGRTIPKLESTLATSLCRAICLLASILTSAK